VTDPGGILIEAESFRDVGGWLNEKGEVARIRFDHPLLPAPASRGGKGDWHWESGFNEHPLNDLEAIRDHNMRAAFGAWNAIKNHGAYASLDRSGRAHATAELSWTACIGGPRETLQLLGTIRVMNTLGMVGVVVGRAAAVACKHDATNRGVYEDLWNELSDLLAQAGDYRLGRE